MPEAIGRELCEPWQKVLLDHQTYLLEKVEKPRLETPLFDLDTDFRPGLLQCRINSVFDPGGVDLLFPPVGPGQRSVHTASRTPL